MNIWNDIPPVAWGDDPLHPQFEADRAEALRMFAVAHRDARARARHHAMAWSLVFAVMFDESHRFLCVSVDQAEALIESAIEISGGTLDADILRPYVVVSRKGVAGPATVRGEREEGS